MPLYEYECEKGHRFEERKKIDDRHNAICPVCASPSMMRISPSNFRFPGMFTVVSNEGQALIRRPTRNPQPDKYY